MKHCERSRVLPSIFRPSLPSWAIIPNDTNSGPYHRPCGEPIQSVQRVVAQCHLHSSAASQSARESLYSISRTVTAGFQSPSQNLFPKHFFRKMKRATENSELFADCRQRHVERIYPANVCKEAVLIRSPPPFGAPPQARVTWPFSGTRVTLERLLKRSLK